MKSKDKYVGLYTPYLDVLGGGELHVLSILKVFEDFGFSPVIFWDTDLSKEIQRVFSLKFRRLRFVKNVFRRKGFEKYVWLKKLSAFIYVTDGSYFFSPCPNNFVFYMVPEKRLFNLSFIDRLKLFNWTLIANSKFTADKIEKWLRKRVKILYPYIEEEVFLKDKKVKKDKIILSVGRFFKGLHSKRQDKIIELFKKIKQKEKVLKDFRLVLVGRLKEEDRDYFRYLQGLVSGRGDIELRVNVKREEVVNLYHKALFYWHFTGYGLKDTESFEKAEHLGVSILEAMAAKCIVFAYDFGGPREIVKPEAGFLFSTEDDLQQRLKEVISDQKKLSLIRENAYKFVKSNFSYNVFKQNVVSLFL